MSSLPPLSGDEGDLNKRESVELQLPIQHHSRPASPPAAHLRRHNLVESEEFDEQTEGEDEVHESKEEQSQAQGQEGRRREDDDDNDDDDDDDEEAQSGEEDGTEDYLLSMAAGMDRSLEENVLLAAQELGIDIPPEPFALEEVFDLTTTNISALTMASSSPGTYTLPSRTSESTRPTSATSSIQQFAQRSEPVVLYPRVKAIRPSANLQRAPLSPLSVSSGETSYAKIRKSFRRLSTFGKRRSPLASTTSIPTQPSTQVSANSEETSSGMIMPQDEIRPLTADPTEMPFDLSDMDEKFPQIPSNSRRVAGTSMLPKFAEEQTSQMYRPPSSLTSTFRSLTPPIEDWETSETREARERSLQCTHLQRLRIRQLEEQSQFLEHQFDQIDNVRSRYTRERQEANQAFKEKQETLHTRHAEKNYEVEIHQLNGEMEVARALETERRACETKLKYMDAYCNRRQTTPLEEDETPRRKVTEDDYRKLVEQYHLRNGMDNLHEARINVLREKQGKQLERIAAKQGAELCAFEDQWHAESERRDAALRREELELKRDFVLKKDRLVWRWKLMEAVERRKLELKSGKEYGELPEVQWGEDEWIRAAL